MKILIYIQESNMRFESLIAPIQSLKAEVGRAEYQINNKDINEFNPDVIIHNSPDTNDFGHKAITIGINELNDERCFSFTNQESSNYIDPFVYLVNEEYNDARYISDVSYIGNPQVFGSLIYDIINRPDILFKFFTNDPISISGYCGRCTSLNYPNVYKMSKASLVPADVNNYRLLDIIYAGGNPIQYQSDEQFLNDIQEAVFNGKKTNVKLNKWEIEQSHTNYDRLASIFQKVGFERWSKEIIQTKEQRLSQ